MKKTLVILVAAIASCFTAIAGNCSPTPTTDTAWVYQWKFSGKTTEGKTLNIASSICSPSDNTSCSAVRTKSSLRIQGYTYYCSPGCGTQSFGESLNESSEIFWHKGPYKSGLTGGLTIEVCNIIGKKGDKCEVSGTTELTTSCGSVYSVTFAGIGKYDRKHNRIKSISGNFAGIVKDPCVRISECSFIPTCVWSCGTSTLTENDSSVAFGKFTCKFKENAAKSYAKNGKVCTIPSWALGNINE